ncbi:MAG TPA: rod shape-determining protein MreD [Bacteroidia bacterium]|nr:MAG: membrane protein [Bacteroidetes bacterium OLB10]MBV6454660.1 hypothetical protein [Bacteroidia bacterium]MBX3107295.1 rod shape-determining protein MreD [Bacteroidota bacterium]OQB61708.1 MAG: hypothetical protein BWX95_01742 [Bacteroidetes bacterium ADurb.Bin141]MCB0848143.1 rod shape-determining protein MreD [Bacteroidota bacterium]
MLAEIIKIIFRFILLVLVQVLLFNKIRFAGFINPFVYPLFILLLPVRIPKTLLLLLSFITGLTIDIFSDTMGMHAAATVFLGYLRPAILKLLAPRDGYEAEASPRLHQMGFLWFLYYLLISIFAHHLFLFYTEVFRFSEFWYTLLRVVLSTLTSVLLIIVILYLFDRQKEKH